MGQHRFDAKEVGDISAEIAVEEAIWAPGRELAKYRHRLNKTRRQMVRSTITDLIASVDETVGSLQNCAPSEAPKNENVSSPKWEELREQVQAMEMLLGSARPRPPRWADLRRHLRFGTVQDLIDIVKMDWPAVRSGLTKGLYDEDEPIPVDVEDIGVLAASQPTGSVATKLKWESLDGESFERLVFALISGTPGYENRLGSPAQKRQIAGATFL